MPVLTIRVSPSVKDMIDTKATALNLSRTAFLAMAAQAFETGAPPLQAARIPASAPKPPAKPKPDKLEKRAAKAQAALELAERKAAHLGVKVPVGPQPVQPGSRLKKK